MKKTLYVSILVCLISVVLISCKKGEESTPKASANKIPENPPVPGTLVITAKLVEIPGTFPPNELYNYAFVMRYESVKVISGSWPDKDILIGHYNPRFPRNEINDDQASKVGGDLKSFKVGDTHYLVLNEIGKMWNGAIEDEPYYKDTRQKWWASWVSKLY